jgi:hypothetical protein
LRAGIYVGTQQPIKITPELKTDVMRVIARIVGIPNLTRKTRAQLYDEIVNQRGITTFIPRQIGAG